MNDNILDDQQFESSKLRRRDLLPIWIKVFTWFFLIAGAIVPIMPIVSMLGIPVDLALYGFESNQPLSLIGLFIIFLFATKGIVAYGLWTEKEWAVNFAMIDAILGMVICTLAMLFAESGPNIELRFELIPLVFYLIKMNEIKLEWKERIVI